MEHSDAVKRKRSHSLSESTDESKKSVQTPSVSSSIVAQSGGNVIAPILTENTIRTVNIFTGTAGAPSAEPEDVHPSSSSDGNTDKSTNKVSQHTNCKPELAKNDIKKISEEIKRKLRRKSTFLFECCAGTNRKQTPQHLKDVYTELYITDGVSEEVKTQHEFRQKRVKSQSATSTQAAIKCEDIFKHSFPIRTVMTIGIAGIGKSVAVQKFILDWRKKKANKDVDFIFLLPFRELNLINDKLSLLELLCKDHPLLKDKVELFDTAKIIFIFDGLDESKFRLDFSGLESLGNITDRSSVGALIVNLLNENLLPSASIWVTTRPAAAHQIPSGYIDRWTEIHGFNDRQKEKYFRKKIKDPTKADIFLQQIKASRSVYIMCDIPVFCWILANGFLRMGTQKKQEIPSTLTELFAQFLLIQLTRKEQKKEHEQKDSNQVLKSNKDVILKLSELAYRELENENVLFSEEDLEKYSIDKDRDLGKPGMCTEFFVSETGISEKKVFCFVHLSIQEFLAALFVFYSFSTGNRGALKSFAMKGDKLHDLLESAVRKSLEYENGHLDLFLRFLLGLSLQSNQELLQGLLTHSQESTGCVTTTVQFIKNTINAHNQSTEKCINLLYCLQELKDRSLHEEVHRYVESGELLSPAICSILAYDRLVSEDTQEVFDLTEYKTTDKGRMRLVIAVRSCRKARLVHCGLTKDSCEIISSALQSEGTELTEVDLSFNAIGDPGVKVLADGLARNRTLDTLRLASCNLTESSCKLLSDTLRHANSPLSELDLTNNSLANSGVKDLCSALCHQNCKLEKLRLAECSLTEGCCEKLASALRSPHSTISELDLSNNDLGDSGVMKLCDALTDPNCKLERLKLSGCLVSERGLGYLSSVLSQSPSHLRELDLSYNYPGDTSSLKETKCHLETLNVNQNDRRWLKPGIKKYAWNLTLDENTAHPEVQLSNRYQTLTHVGEDQLYHDHKDRFDNCPQVLCKEGLRERHYWEAEWSGKEAVIGVAYHSIRKKLTGADCKMGLNDKSCGLWCEGARYSVRHNKNKTVIPVPASFSTHSRRVGIYLDWPAGTLSFYSVYSGKLVHLHTFHSKFTEPLYPGFWVHVDSSVSLCQVA